MFPAITIYATAIFFCPYTVHNKNYPTPPCALAEKFTETNMRGLVSSNRDRFAYRTTKYFLFFFYNSFFFLLFLFYAGSSRMPPRVLTSGPKPCGGNNMTWSCWCLAKSTFSRPYSISLALFVMLFHFFG